MTGISSLTAHGLIGYFEVTWHRSTKLFPAKSLCAGNNEYRQTVTRSGNSSLFNTHEYLPIAEN